MTHPIQYYSPWFRHIARNEPHIELTVHYCLTPTPAQQGVGFDRAFEWDSSLLDGYENVVLRGPSENVNIHSSSFFGVNVGEIAQSIESAKPDAVLVPGWYSWSLIRAAIAARRLRVPVLFRGDSQLPGRAASRNSVRSLRTRALLRLYTHYLSVGIRNREFLLYHGIPEEKIFFSPHCVDNAFFASASESTRLSGGRDAVRRTLDLTPDDFVVLFAGKLETKKRPWEVVEAAAALDRKAVVIIAGSGALETRCRDMAAKLNVDARFMGFRNPSALAQLYSISDCLALPSDATETWGLVVNEALASGLPCIVSEAAGCAPDLITDGETGYQTKPGDVASISIAMQKIGIALDAGQSFRDACLRRADRYSYASATAGLVNALAQAAG
jgi:glycosyltransferase involved in cell wall biosynthesis